MAKQGHYEAMGTSKLEIEAILETGELPHERAARLLQIAGSPRASAADRNGVVSYLSFSTHPQDSHLPYLVALKASQKAGDMQHEPLDQDLITVTSYLFGCEIEPSSQKIIVVNGTNQSVSGSVRPVRDGFSKRDYQKIDMALNMIEQELGKANG